MIYLLQGRAIADKTGGPVDYAQAEHIKPFGLFANHK